MLAIVITVVSFNVYPTVCCPVRYIYSLFVLIYGDGRLIINFY